MTSIDHFAIATETLGKQCIELSRPPHDVRFGDDGLISVDTRTGQYRATAKIVVDGMVFIDMRGPLKELAEIKKRNGSSNARTILEESARQAIAEAEAQQAADEECEAALAANRSDPAPDTPHCVVAAAQTAEEHAPPSPSLLQYRAEIAAGVDPLEAIRREIDRDEAAMKRQEAAALPPPSDGLRTPAEAARKPRHPPPDGLKTAAQAAARLGCSIKTLNGHVAAGALKYVAIGHGKRRKRKMFTDADLDEFIQAQTRKDVPCPSTKTRARRTGNLTSSGEVIAFTAQPRPRPGGKRRR